MAATANTAAIFASPSQPLPSKRNFLNNSTIGPIQRRFPRRKLELQVKAVATTLAPLEEISEYKLPSWAMFEMGTAPVYWKTMNGLPPTAGEKLKLFYNPAATKLNLNEDYGVAFNGGFNQPIMCGGEPRAMLKKDRGKADSPIFTMQICIPKHAVNLIFSFTNGVDWDGPYRLQFQVPKRWQNKPIEFFNESTEIDRRGVRYGLGSLVEVIAEEEQLQASGHSSSTMAEMKSQLAAANQKIAEQASSMAFLVDYMKTRDPNFEDYMAQAARTATPSTAPPSTANPSGAPPSTAHESQD